MKFDATEDKTRIACICDTDMEIVGHIEFGRKMVGFTTQDAILAPVAADLEAIAAEMRRIERQREEKAE